LELLRPGFVGLLNMLLLLQKPKANQKAHKPQLLLPKSCFYSSTKLKETLSPAFSCFWGKITHMPLVMKIMIHFFFILSSYA
jgi:hypothetical protein